MKLGDLMSGSIRGRVISCHLLMIPLIYMLAAVTCAGPLKANSPSNQASPDPGAEKIAEADNMSDQKLTPVPTGVWGGQDIILTVEGRSVAIEYGCASGEIPQKLYVDKNGNFSVDGSHTQRRPGPTREDHLPVPKPAHYNGKIEGSQMTLNVTLKEGNVEVGNYTLERGKRVRLMRCG